MRVNISSPKQTKSVSVDYGSIAACSVGVVTPVYIDKYLIANDDAKPSPDDYLIEPFKEH